MNALLSLVLLSAGWAGGEPVVHRDLSYSEPSDPRRSLDLYVPAGAKDCPVFVWIHGGGWRAGDKSGVQEKPKAFTDKGFAFVSINYRLVPLATVKEMTGDVAASIRWLRDHAKQYGIAADKIYIGGHSAGAHLAALVCTDDRYFKAAGMPISAIRGCVPIDTAVYDVTSQIDGIREMSVLYAAAFGNDTAVQKDLSPATHVAKGKSIPPFLIYCAANRPDARGQSESFAKKLESAGVAVRLVAAENKTHASINRDFAVPNDPTTKALWDFLKVPQ